MTDRFKCKDEQMRIVQQNPHDIQFIENPSLAVQLAAVQQNAWAIKYIENPSEAVQLAAVQKYGDTIEYIKSPSLEVQLAAVRYKVYLFQFINNPYKDVVITAILKLIQEGDYFHIKGIISKYDNYNWPELDIIKTSLRADGKIK